MRRAILAAVAVAFVLSLSACGGGSPTPPNNPTVTVSPATANVQEGSQQQFSATVTNTTATAVTWQVNGVTGGNGTVGTISSTGLYKAPDVIPSPASVTITAALQSAPSIFGNSIATLTAVVFNNSSLKGTYVLSVSGLDGNALPFQALAAVTADGNGNITGGEEDLNDSSIGFVAQSSITGTYNVGSDGRGTLTLNIPALNSTPFSYAIAMRALDNAVVNEVDSNVVAATGNLEAQGASPAIPSGNYAFGFSGGGGGCTAVNSAGFFAMNSNTLGGVQDVNCGGGISVSQTLSGSYSGLDSFARGTGSFSSNAGSSPFVFYVISPNRFRFIGSNASLLLLGSADLQTQSSFASTDFSGSYVVSTSASTTTGSNGGVSYTLIQFNASGGQASSGYYDVNDTGNVGQANLNGSYTLNSNGYIRGTFNVNSAGLPFAIYLISPTQGYYLDERTSIYAGGGNVYAQSGSVTSNAAWAGSYATKQFGYFVPTSNLLTPSNASGLSGQISADGNGNLAGTLDLNDPVGVLLNQTLQGTYQVGTTAPGRMTLSITTPQEGTRNYVGYIVDQTRVLLLENDTNLVSGGDAIRQF